MKKRIFLVSSLLIILFLSSLSGVAGTKSAFVTLTGHITAGGSNLSGVTVVASGAIGGCGGGWTGTTSLTNAFGYFTMSVPDDCYFIITPSKKNYTFDPAYWQVTPVNVGETFEFTGTLN